MPTRFGESRRWARIVVIGAAAAATTGPITAVTGAAATTGGRGAVAYAVDRPVCPTAVKPHRATCFAVRRLPARAGAPGASPAQIRSPDTAGALPAAIGLGPAGGYTPDDLAAAYNYNAAASRSSQTVAVVTWYDDPKIGNDLAAFDSEYGLPAETPTSFRRVNQHGAGAPLPSSTNGKQTAAETALDAESVRGVCHTCRILLVEANSSQDSDLATAENTAVRLGATEVANSFGEPEGSVSASTLSAFNHPGVVITAPTGDRGWYGWDAANGAVGVSANAPSFPATDPGVIAVGGTTLELNNDGSRNSETVWDGDGPDDGNGLSAGQPAGATGGGCSQRFSAPGWQASSAGYTAAGCAGKRLAADVSALGDPATGVDVYDTWGAGDSGWVTMGGTSLSASVVAAMYALAGGSGGATYPAASAYENAVTAPASVFDVTFGGNGFCGGDTTLNCGNAASSDSGGATHNPNALGGGIVDCSFPRNTSDPPAPPALSPECNAVAGLDGPSGLGSPTSAALFTPTSPAISLRRPSIARFKRPTVFTATATDRVSGQHVTNVTFVWGDGHSSSGTTLSRRHTYTKRGTYTASVVVTDSANQQGLATTMVTIGKPLSVKFFGSRSARAGHKARFHVEISDRNTGGKVKSVRWSWGDRTSSKGTKAAHVWHRAGTYRIKLRVKDNTGVVTTRHLAVAVR